MSRVYYQFATATQTSWCHRLKCDLCGAQLERSGPLPKLENGPIPAPFSSRGWASFSMRATQAPVDADGKPYDLPEDLWPSLDRDLCPGCARMVNDQFCAWGLNIGVVEYRLLDALGRPAGGETELLGVRVCNELYAAGRRCWRPAGHAGEHGLLEEGLSFCCLCFAGRETGAPRTYTQVQLESHAVDQHSVRFSEGLAGAPIGWYSEREHPPIVYADVFTALRAEQTCIERERREAEIQRQHADFENYSDWGPRGGRRT